jgi:hypothetical protein
MSQSGSSIALLQKLPSVKSVLESHNISRSYWYLSVLSVNDDFEFDLYPTSGNESYFTSAVSSDLQGIGVTLNNNNN